MRVIYLANVGTRDVQRDGRPLDKPRLDGEALLTVYDTVRSELTAPILSAGIAHVLQKGSKVARVQLFVSDQPDPPITADQHWERDTVAFGQLLQRILREEFGDRVEQIKCEPMRLNPADYNSMLPWFAERLPVLLPPGDAEVVYVAPVGGADASNVALTINAVRCYRERCQFIYVMPDGQVHLLSLHKELLGDYARQEAAAHIHRNDYAALRETLRRARLGQEWHLHVCDYADRRMCFDFRRAKAALQKGTEVADSGEARAQLAQLDESLEPFLHERVPPTSTASDVEWAEWYRVQQQLLGELFFNLRLKAHQGEWVDFLGRIFRLQESLLRLVFELETRHSSDKHPEREFADFVEAIESNFALREYLQNHESAYQEANSHNLALALAFWVEHGKGKEYGGLRKTLQTIGGQKLSHLRNKSILAHGYEGISREDIEQAAGMPVDQFLEKIREALNKLGGTVENSADPYAAAQRLLQYALKCVS